MRVNQGRTWEVVSLCAFRIEFGDGCDRPCYVGRSYGSVAATLSKPIVQWNLLSASGGAGTKGGEDFVRGFVTSVSAAAGRAGEARGASGGLDFPGRDLSSPQDAT